MTSAARPPSESAKCTLLGVQLEVDHGRAMHLFAPNEECLLRACQEVGITARQMHQDVGTIREWMAQQPHLSMRGAVPAFFAQRDPLSDELQEIVRHCDPSSPLFPDGSCVEELNL